MAHTVNVSGSCKTDTFEGKDELPPNKYGCDAQGNNCASTYDRSGNIPLARNLVKDASSDVLNNLGAYLGVAFLF